MANRPIFITVCLFIVLLLGIAALWPKYQDLKRNQAKIETKEKELQNREQYLSHLRQLHRELQKYQASLSKIDSSLPSSISLPDLYYFLQKASSQSGLVLTSVGQPSSNSLGKNTSIKAHSIGLSLSGSYTALKSFLSVLGKSARLIEIESIGFSSPPPGSPFSFGLRIKVHSY